MSNGGLKFWVMAESKIINENKKLESSDYFLDLQ